MADTPGGPRGEDDLVERLRLGTVGISPRADALDRVHREVGTRRRRRRTAGFLAVAATVTAVAVPTAVLSTGGDGPGREPPVAGPTATPTEDARRPAAFFVDLVGGRSRAKVIRYRPVAGVNVFARFVWFDSDDRDTDPVHVGVGVERYDGTPAEGCQALVDAGGGECAPLDDGWQAHTVDLTAAEARMAPFHDVGPLTGPGDHDLVRRATVVRDDGLAVTILMCACSPTGPDLSEPPLRAESLASAAAAPRWVLR